MGRRCLWTPSEMLLLARWPCWFQKASTDTPTQGTLSRWIDGIQLGLDKKKLYLKFMLAGSGSAQPCKGKPNALINLYEVR